MSAAILVSQTWQPTVLQLMPFSSNNASAVGNRSDSGGKNRDFPTLAVTRSHDDWVAHIQSSSRVQRATSERMPRSHYNQLTGRQNYSKRAQSEYKVREKHKSEAVLEKTCSVNDINNKIVHTTTTAHRERDSPKPKVLHSAATVSLTEIHGLSKPLQNHAPQKTWDGHYYLPQNGFWRAMTLTPGELDLQKHREVMNREQVKRTKKLKMNINQLPRSNTPINDNDPDKLNMQQVIQFLKNHNDGSDDAKANPMDRSKYDRDKEYFLRKRGCASASVEIATRQLRNGIQTKSTDGMIPRYLREATMASTRSSPLLRDRAIKQANGQTEWKPVSEGESVLVSGGSNKPFRLHRFLKMTPTCESNNAMMNRAYTQVPCSHTLKTLEISDQIHMPKAKHDLHRFDPPTTHHKSIPTADRHCRMAYRLPSKRPSAKPAYRSNEMGRIAVGCAVSTECNQSVGSDGAIIRLPSMHDFKNDSDNESDDDDNYKQTRAETKSEIVHHNTNQGTGIPTVHASKVAFVEPYKPTFKTDSGFRCQAEAKPSLKKLYVSVPRESHAADVNVSKHSSAAGCVKICLRKERGLTRESTYMSDLDRAKYVLADSSSESRESSNKKTSSLSVENKTEKDDDDISSRTS
ncbi:uncharacterized protein LOC121370771 [Gigantopelta aegis]|uniref:uncharacterized protein LOC121370771 n=1 Tax=Gigantopelta aegis TaxID=1735272 RepID=UPI001B88A0D2|nr:uncharacterized protein LOC121370771 [Gigantopelta aegis]